MRIAVDVTPLSVTRSGVGSYIRGAIEGLERAGCEVTAFAVTGRDGRASIVSALGGRTVAGPALPAANVVRRGWSAARLVRLERLTGRFDGTLLSDWWYPPQRNGVRATVVHDLVPLHFPEWVSKRTLLGHRATYRRLLPTVDVLFAVSSYTRDDIVRTLGVDERQIHVARPGVDARFTPDGPRADLGRPYALVVGTLEPRKNLQVVLEAKRRHPDLPDVAFVGATGWGDVPELAAPGIVRLGYEDDARVVELLRGAECLVFPSLFEGFGMPPVEAMACGCPVVCSSHPSLDEAAGDAAVRFDPHDPDALARAVEEARRNRSVLRERGLEHSRGLTWQATGTALRAGYEAASSSA
jgi:glycosyltransferase involved in cell wall biosynthesis